MPNNQILIPVAGVSTNQFLRMTLIESGQSGLFRATFDIVGSDQTAPSLQASIVAAASRLAQADRPLQINTSTTPTVQPSATNNGLISIGTKASGNQTYTLPAAQTAGFIFTFVCGSAAGELLVNPVGTDTISIKASEGGASVVTAAGVGIKNTAATNVLNDHITLVSDGVSQWWTIAESGIWASQ
jgi:hypothetical protein